MLLAGDVGGTKTLLGLFTRGDRRPQPVTVLSYPTRTFSSFGAMLAAFARDVGQPLRVEAAVAGVAGPVDGNHVHLTNIAWDISVEEIALGCGTRRVRLVNDLEAMASGATVLTADEVVVLQEGIARADGHAAVIAAGTGLGEAYLRRVGDRWRPAASEGGHADFAARTDREIELLQMLRAEYGRAEVEHVLSGPGLLNLHRFTHRTRSCVAVRDATVDAGPAAISEAAILGRCAACVEALSMFISAYGAEAGNLALRGVATAGLYVGGGIAPKILPLLQDGRFMDAFRAKGAMSEMLGRIPVRVILNADAALVGAAVFAQEMANSR